MEWYLKVLKNYAKFSGRARRKEYWMFVLFDSIFILLLIFFDVIIGTFDTEAGMGLLGGLYLLALFIPRLAVTVRRLHDIGMNGWMVLIGFIPLVGPFVLLAFMVQDSRPGENQYGPNPKTEAWDTD